LASRHYQVAWRIGWHVEWRLDREDVLV
jgi:hypothetical protein